jgi:RNA polymerase sigma factor (sigma-70 family)
MNPETLFDVYRKLPTEDSLEALLGAYSDTVYNVCYQVLRHPQDAEDASQKVFFEVVRRIGKAEDAEHFKRSLYRISFHVALNHKRESRARIRHERKRASMQEPQSPPAAAPQDFPALHEQISRLEAPSQELIVEYYFEGKKLAELAATYGSSTVAVWKRLEKAKDQLRKALMGAGLAGMSALVEPTLEAMSFAPAPKGLLSRDLVARALAARQGAGALAAFSVLGAGAAKKVALLTAALGLLVVSAAGYQVVRRRPSPEASARAGVGDGRTNLRAAGRDPARIEGAGLPSPQVPRFASTTTFRAEFERAAHLVSDPERTKALRGLGFALSEDDFRAVTKDCRGKKGSHRFAHELEAALLDRWTRKDPRAAASLFRDLPQDDEEPHPYDQIISGKTGAEFPRTYRYTKLRDAVVLWSKSDFDAARLFVETVPAEDRENLHRCLEARQDPEALSRTVLSLSGKGRSLAMKELALSWGEKNPHEALRWGERLPEPAELSTAESFLEYQLRSDFLSGTVGSWARSHPEEALAWVLEAPDRRGLVFNVIEEVAKTDPKGAVGIVDRHLAPDDSANLYDQALMDIAFLHPDSQAAADMLVAHRPDGSRSGWYGMLSAFVTSWAENDDADLALRWASEQPDSMVRSALVIAAAVGRATSVDLDIVGAMAALHTLPEEMRSRGAQSIFSAYGRQHPAEATALAHSFQQPVPVMEVAEELSRQDLEGALTWGRSLPDAPTRDKALCILATGPLGLCYQGEDVPRAIALASEIADPSIRLHTQGKIAGYWASRSDPEPVLDWVLGLPGDPLPSAAGRDDWTYHTRNSRKDIFESVVGTWSYDDGKRELARRWIEQSPLPDACKRALFRKLDNRE